MSKGKGRSVEDQETENRAECERHGWDVTEVYTDTISASRFARKGRPGWGRLLADLDAGAWEVLVLWESSRGDRSLGSWVGMLDLCRARGVAIHVTSHSRTYDISIPRDWRNLAEDGVDSAYESEKTSLRLRRDLDANAREGRPHGMTNYGYERVYDPHTRKLVEQRIHPQHAEIVREIFTRAARGIPLTAIARDLNERKVPAPKAAAWSRAGVRKLLLNPVYIGKRMWKGELLDASWPPIVTATEFWDVRNLLLDERRKTSRPGSQKYLLSYLARCGVCGQMLCAYPPRQGKKYTMYGCTGNGCVYVRADYLDAYVSGRVIGYLSDPGFIAALRAAASGGGEAAQARALAAELEGRLAAAYESFAAGDLSAGGLVVVEKRLVPQIEAARQRERRAIVPAVLADLVPAEVITDAWGRMPMITRKEVIRACYEVRVDRATRRGPGFEPGRVILTEQPG